MNSRLLLTFVPLAGLVLAGCNKTEPSVNPPPRTADTTTAAPAVALPPVETPPPPVPEGPTASEKKNTEKMRAMEVHQAELQQQLEDEKLARLEAEMATEQALLDKERAAWSAEQVSIPATVPVAAQPVLDTADYNNNSGASCDYQTFYDDLAPYGTWYNSPDYGYCWQPSVYLSDNSWRPYTRGSWNSCDSGWAWCSDEPFGWACYHYGRWAKCRQRGWVWIPGDQWAPAWVCWRKNDDYVGWCPLPPETVYNHNCTWGSTVDTDCGIHPSCYVFVPCKHFDKPVLGYCEAPSLCLRICGSTVNVTNIICRPGHVQCDGPQYDWIVHSVRRPVPRYTLAWDTGREAHSHPAHRFERDHLHFFAPKLETPWNAALRPRTTVARLENEVFVRATGGVPEKLATRFKTERTEREKALTSDKAKDKAVREILERQQRLAEMQQSRETLAAESRRHAETVKSKLAEQAPRPEAPPSGKPPRTYAGVPQQTGGDVVNAPLPGRTRTSPAVAEVPRSGTQPVTNDAVVDPKHQTSAPRFPAEEPRSRVTKPNVSEAATPAQIAAAQQAALEAQRRQAEADALAQTNALKDRQRQMDDHRAALTEQRQSAAARLAAEQQAREESARAAAVKDRTRELETARAAAMEQQRASEVAARAEQAARQREEIERQRASLEQQRRQQEVAAQAAREESMRREAAAQEQRRQAQEEQQQRRQAEEQQQRRAAEENAARQREASERHQAEENQRQAAAAAAAENSRRQAEENSRREASERDRQEQDHKRGK